MVREAITAHFFSSISIVLRVNPPYKSTEKYRAPIEVTLGWETLVINFVLGNSLSLDVHFAPVLIGNMSKLCQNICWVLVPGEKPRLNWLRFGSKPARIARLRY